MSTENATPNWTELKGKIKARWGKFADADVDGFRDNMHLITETIQKKYGYAKDKAEQEYKDFKMSLEPKVAAAEKSTPAN